MRLTDAAAEASSFFIKGITGGGQTFRPSDWAERLCGVMANVHPQRRGPLRHLQFSPFVQPMQIDDVKCVRVDAELASYDPMAYRFLQNFASDNDLQISAEALAKVR